MCSSGQLLLTPSTSPSSVVFIINFTSSTSHHQLHIINLTSSTSHHHLHTINFTSSTSHHQLNIVNFTSSTSHHQLQLFIIPRSIAGWFAVADKFFKVVKYSSRAPSKHPQWIDPTGFINFYLIYHNYRQL